jgi:hypothetical protein
MLDRLAEIRPATRLTSDSVENDSNFPNYLACFLPGYLAYAQNERR